MPVLDYVLGALQEESRVKKLPSLNQMAEEQVESFQEGKIVISFDSAENAYSRYVYLQPDIKEKKATLVNIDSPKELANISFSKILPAEDEAYHQPALGFYFTAIEKMSPNAEQRLVQMAIKESFEAKVLYVKVLKDGRLKHMTVAILNSDGNPIMNYKVEPYYFNKKVAKLMKLDSSIASGDLKGVMLTTDDKVHVLWDVSVKFGQWSDLLMVMRIKDVEQRNELQKRLQASCINAPPLVTDSYKDVQEIRGILVACKFSNDGQFYRAVVTGTKPDKARVSFVDYGTTEGKYSSL